MCIYPTNAFLLSKLISLTNISNVTNCKDIFIVYSFSHSLKYSSCFKNKKATRLMA